MNYMPNIPEIALLQTGHNEKTLVFIVLTQTDADYLIQLFNDYSIWWGNDKQLGYRIRLTFGELNEGVYVRLTQELTSYKNIDWLLNHEVTSVSVGIRKGDGRTPYFEPIALNYQEAQ